MNIVVIGLGSMGKRRIRLLQKLVPDSMVVGIDNNIERANAVAEKYGIVCYSSLKEIEKHFDCAFICTSPLSHGSIINECLQKGCHIFSEINLVDNLYKENIQLAKEKGKCYFFHPHLFIKEK